ncbi:hypothetical protein GCM10008992_25360 [Halorubrum aquaticum]
MTASQPFDILLRVNAEESRPRLGYKGEKTRVSPVYLRVSLECGLEPKGTDSPNPVDGFHVLQGVEEVNS